MASGAARARLTSRIPLVAALALSACSGLVAQPPDVVVGALYPLTGPQASGGREELAGVRAALELASRSGALGSRRVELRVMDIRTPEQARAAVNRLIDRDHVAVVIGTYGSTLAAAAASRAEERRTVYWETGAVADEITMHRRYVFRTVASGNSLGRLAVDFTARVLIPAAGLQPAESRAVIVQVDDLYGRSVSDAEAARAAGLGIRVVDRIPYDAHAYDASAIAARLAAARPDYLWDVSYLEDGIDIWRAIAQRGVRLRGAVGTSSAFCMPEFGRRLGPLGNGVYAADKPDEEIKPEALATEGRALLMQARTAYAATTGGQEMSISAVAGFVGGWTLFHEVFPRLHGTVTAETIRDAALGVDVPEGAAINGGGVRFASDDAVEPGQNRRTAVVVSQWQQGRLKAVYPAAYAEAPPIIGAAAPATGR